MKTLFVKSRYYMFDVNTDDNNNIKVQSSEKNRIDATICLVPEDCNVATENSTELKACKANSLLFVMPDFIIHNQDFMNFLKSKNKEYVVKTVFTQDEINSMIELNSEYKEFCKKRDEERSKNSCCDVCDFCESISCAN